MKKITIMPDILNHLLQPKSSPAVLLDDAGKLQNADPPPSMRANIEPAVELH